MLILGQNDTMTAFWVTANGNRLVSDAGVPLALHRGVEAVHIDMENIANSRTVLQAKMHTSCFYPFVQYMDEDTLAMSYTINREHIRIGKFDLSKYTLR